MQINQCFYYCAGVSTENIDDQFFIESQISKKKKKDLQKKII